MFKIFDKQKKVGEVANKELADWVDSTDMEQVKRSLSTINDNSMLHHTNTLLGFAVNAEQGDTEIYRTLSRRYVLRKKAKALRIIITKI